MILLGLKRKEISKAEKKTPGNLCQKRREMGKFSVRG